ncbi:MAG: AzlC family ABC transporter permease [Gammaproteobacteria bacterium]|nr:AzlC family ABC transporter permease [Gammaproteobacteria bacterium]
MLPLKRTDYKQGWHRGLIESISISLAGGLFGLGVGALASENGLSFMQSALMSVTMYAGAAQVIAIGMLSAPFSLPVLLLTVLLITARYGLMSFSLRAYFEKVSWRSLALSLHTVMDENWALTLLRARTHRSALFLYGYFLGSGVLAYIIYVASSMLGYIAIKAYHHSQIIELSFVFSAVFIAMLSGSWRGKKDILPWVASFILAIMFKKLLPGSLYIVSAGVLASLIGLAYESFE